MEKVFFGVFAVAIALVASSFTSGKDISKFDLPITYYNYLGTGTLQKPEPGSSCTTADDHNCSYIFQNPENIDHSLLPSTIQFNASSLGTVIPDGPLSEYD